MSWSTGVIELFALYTYKSPVILSRDSHGQRSLAGYSSKGRTESDTIEMICQIICQILHVHYSLIKYFYAFKY